MSIVSINNTNLKGIKANSIVESKFQGFTAEYLVVAGGAGGGSGEANARAGGGGAGGLVNSFASESSGGGDDTAPKNFIELGKNYLVAVGAGGTGSNLGRGGDSRGGSSQFQPVTTIGGGIGSARHQGGSDGGK